MKKIIAFIILVILVILVICLSYNYYKKQDAKRVNKLKSDLETSEILNNNSNSDDNDRIEVEEQDTNNSTDESKKSKKTKKSSSEDSIVDDGETEEETTMNVPDTASNDNKGYIKLKSYSVSINDSIIKVGKSTNIKVTYNPKNASIRDTAFKSLNNNCKVSSLGKVTGLKKGACSIIVKVKGLSSKNIVLAVK